MVSVGEARGYLGFLVDEIAYLENMVLSLPSRDEMLIKSMRQCLDALNINSYVENGRHSIPTIRLKGQDSLIKVYSSFYGTKMVSLVEKDLISTLGDEIELISIAEEPWSQTYWLAAAFDYKLRCYNPPKYRLLFTSKNTELIAAICLLLDNLGIYYRTYKSKSDLISLSIGKRESIKKVASLPLNERLKADIQSVLGEEVKRKTQYDYSEMGRLHYEGMPVSKICSLLGISPNKVGYIASMIRKRGFEVRRQR